MLFFLHIDVYFCSFLLLAKVVAKNESLNTHLMW
jgi:hypothetical protein